MIYKVHSDPLTFHASMKAVHGIKQGLMNSKALPRKRIEERYCKSSGTT